MIVYDDIAPLEKIKVYDVRVERPPHYNTFAEFQYAYHYGDTYSPFIKHDEPLKTECQHFVECITDGLVPLTSGASGLEVVRILEASSKSLAAQGAPVMLWGGSAVPFQMARAAGQAMGTHSRNGQASGTKEAKDSASAVAPSSPNDPIRTHDGAGNGAKQPATPAAAT
jgi:hypothetical protein